MNAVEVEQVVKVYKSGTQALKSVSLEIKEGDFFALLGANGAGKTTLLGIMTGLVNKTAGTIRIFGHDIDQEHDQARAMTGIVPQEFNFNIFEKVIDIVVQQAGYYGVPRKEALKRAEPILKALNLWEKRNTVSMQLSGGMKRRLMIARALVHHPKLLILDEPTAGVDVELRHGMWEYLKDLNAKGTTILLTTHYLEEVEALCRNVTIIKDGTAIQSGAVDQLLNSLDTQTYVVRSEKLPKNFKLQDYELRVLDEQNLEVDLKAKQTLTDFVTAMDKAKQPVVDLRLKANRMEQLYLSLTK